MGKTEIRCWVGVVGFLWEGLGDKRAGPGDAGPAFIAQKRKF